MLVSWQAKPAHRVCHRCWRWRTAIATRPLYAPIVPLVINVLVIAVGRRMARCTSADFDSHRLSTGRQAVLDSAVHEAECRR
jgi:hypothetical protein